MIAILGLFYVHMQSDRRTRRDGSLDRLAFRSAVMQRGVLGVPKSGAQENTCISGVD